MQEWTSPREAAKPTRTYRFVLPLVGCRSPRHINDKVLCQSLKLRSDSGGAHPGPGAERTDLAQPTWATVALALRISQSELRCGRAGSFQA